MTKGEIRTMIRRLKAERLSAASSLPVCDRVMQCDVVKRADCVLLYHALPDEVDTTPLLAALGDKRVLLPVVVGDDLELRVYTGETRKGAFGIAEPVGPVFADYNAVDVAIVPGMAFTNDGKRLGRGKGYYDRLLPRLTRAYKIGLCYSWQIVDDIPTLPHDIMMDTILAL